MENHFNPYLKRTQQDYSESFKVAVVREIEKRYRKRSKRRGKWAKKTLIDMLSFADIISVVVIKLFL